jgi:prepilin-type N-terminal cleavage/methylation domain-containing protein
VSKRSEAGYTLVELMLVMAITGLLAVIAIVGQAQARRRAVFDEAVHKAVESMADARNEATAGINIVGNGEGTAPCPGGPNVGPNAGPDDPYVLAGTSWTADNSAVGNIIKIDYYKTLPGGAACIFDTKPVGMPPGLQVNVTSQPSQIGRVLFVRTANGSLAVCAVTSLATNVLPSFQNGGCGAGTFIPAAPTPFFTFRDDEGRTSKVEVEQSGLARRTN